MKLMYDEEILYKVMTDQVLPNVFKEIYSIPNHLILAVKKSNNNLPNQTQNLGYIITVLAATNLSDNSIKMYSVIKWENRKSSFAYVSTLILALLIPICFINRIKSTLLFTVIVVAVWIVHFIWFSALATSSEKRKNKKITEVYNKIIE